MPPPHHRLALAAFGAYSILAVICTWPLPLYFSSHLPGAITGDLGVYVWNLWLFRHEIVAHHSFPFFTHQIFWLEPRIDLSLHNYTPFLDLLAFPLLSFLDVVATFNAIYLGMFVLSGWTLFLLARHLTGRVAESWLAGMLFAASPILVARSEAHISLVAAAPLPVFLWFLIQTERTCSPRHAAGAGAAVAWATLCDPYFGIFCVVLAAVYFAARRLRIQVGDEPLATTIPWIRVVDVLAVCLAGLIAGIAMTGGLRFTMGSRAVSLHSLYTPVLALTLLVLIRTAIVLRPSISMRRHTRLATLATAGVTALVACLLPLSPVLYALTFRLADGVTLQGPVFWRSSPRGLDLLAYLVPNPNHPLFGGAARAWVSTMPGSFSENVASLPFVALACLGFAVWKLGFRPPREWSIVAVLFGLMALGPFVQVAGVNTYLPGPWALLRYIPGVGAARTPHRFAIVLMLAFSILFALALTHITARYPARRRAILIVVGLLLLAELMPAPRALRSAEIPDIYRTIKDDPRDVRVLELPFGFRDGESSHGNFNAASQFYQTFHEKALIGGYLSRIPRKMILRQKRHVMVRKLLRMSEGRPNAIRRPEILRAWGRSFVRRANIGYVVIDTKRATPELREFAIRTFRLVPLGTSGTRELYRPAGDGEMVAIK
jgi:hypothetical protein